MEIIVAIANACQDLECWVKLLPLGFERTGSGSLALWETRAASARKVGWVASA
jgi:hypothetical protein